MKLGLLAITYFKGTHVFETCLKARDNEHLRTTTELCIGLVFDLIQIEKLTRIRFDKAVSLPRKQNLCLLLYYRSRFASTARNYQPGGKPQLLTLALINRHDMLFVTALVVSSDHRHVSPIMFELFLMNAFHSIKFCVFITVLFVCDLPCFIVFFVLQYYAAIFTELHYCST